MACGGFTCSKNALAALNVLYILVAFILIGVAAYGKAAAIITSFSILGGIIACGVFLLLIAIVGLVGAVKHHQVLLFFYMIILFLIFLVQFAVACACLAMNEHHQETITKEGWRYADPILKQHTQQFFNCCGYEEESRKFNVSAGMGHPSCELAACCHDTKHSCCSATPTNSTGYNEDDCACATCWAQMKDHVNRAVKLAGGIGLFFSFTEIIGVWLALRFRNQKDPRANPSAFL